MFNGVDPFIKKSYKMSQIWRTGKNIELYKFTKCNSVIPRIVPGIDYDVPFDEIAIGLAQLILPLIPGMILNHFFRKPSEIGKFIFCLEA